MKKRQVEADWPSEVVFDFLKDEVTLIAFVVKQGRFISNRVGSSMMTGLNILV